MAYWEAALLNSEGEMFKYMNAMGGRIFYTKSDADFDSKKHYDLELKEMTKLIKSILKDNNIYAFGDEPSMYLYE